MSQTINLTKQLQQKLPNSLLGLLRKVGEEAVTMHYGLYVVGGVVRDLLLDYPILDIDLVVEGEAILLAKIIQTRHGGEVRAYSRFGTASWLLSKPIEGINHLDFATARTEVYEYPASLPDVESASIKEDIGRRDFTINALAISLNPTNFGDMIDFFHGHDDLEKGIIRVLHEHSFKDDPTRIFRAVRFESRFDFQIEPDTLGYLDNALEIISYLTSKRIWAELKRILNESMPDKALKRLGDLGIFTAIYPNLQMDDTLLNQCRMLRDGCEELHWSKIKPSNIHYVGLFTFPMGYEQMRELVLRLKLPNNVRRILQHVQAIKIIVPKLKMPQSDSQLYALLSPYNDSALFICWLAIEDTTVRQKLIHFSKNLRHVRPLINGTYLVENMGLSPSPIFSKILTMLRNARLDKKVSTLTDEHDCVVMFITNKAKGLYDESTNTY